LPRLTETRARTAKLPDKGYRFEWCSEIRGFGVRITANGARSYVVGTRFYGLWKPITIGRVGTMSCDSAAELARVALNAASTARGHPAPSRWRYAG